MLKNYNQIYRASLCTLILTQAISPAHGNVYKAIAQENLKSLPPVSHIVPSVLINEKFYELLNDELKKQLNIPFDLKRRFAFSLMQDYQPDPISEFVLDQKSWQDLELLCGPKSAPAQYIATTVDRTITELGRVTLYKMLITPQTDIAKITEQQTFIKCLLDDSTLLDSLTQNLKDLVVPENVFFSLWEDGVFKTTLQQDFNIAKFSKKLNTFCNINPAILEFSEKSAYAENAAMFVFMGVGSILLFSYAALLLAQSSHNKTVKKWNDFLGVRDVGKYTSLPGLICWGIESINNKFNKKPAPECTECKQVIGTPQPLNEFLANSLAFVISIIAGSAALNWSWYCHGVLKDKITFGNCLHTKLIHMARYLTITQSIINVLEAHPLCSSYSVTQEIKEHFNSLYTSEKQLLDLCNLLATSTFKDKASIFTYRGRVYAAYRLLHTHKIHFIKLLAALAKLDALTSAARVYKEFEHTDHPFCFAEFSQGDAPAIYLEEFWNPMTSALPPVTNTCALGAQFNERPHMIITGPNAGGKTTTLRSMVLNVLFAQSLGISPARRCIITPFSKVITYLNITDDQAAGNSHFKAGVIRARELLTTVDQAKGFTLTAVDEAFNGTAFKEGQAAAYSLIKLLGVQPHNICITSTHFPVISALEQNTQLFANYKVTADESGPVLKFPFKLERGISDQIITFKLLHEEGFSDEFLAEAEKILQES